MEPLDALLWNNPAYVDDLYRRYQRDPSAVDASWRAVFATLARDPSHRAPPLFLTTSGGLPDGLRKESLEAGIQIYDLVHTFREYGHLIAQIDPLGRGATRHPFLDLGAFGFSEEDLDQVVQCEGFHGAESATVREFIDILRETYCGPIGVEYMDLMDKDQRDWLQARMEPLRNRPQLSSAKKRALLERVVAADTFEETLHRMYPGAKRFSLEGGTTLVTLLDEILEAAGDDVVEQIVVGMAHRGRLNVLHHILRKPIEYLLSEFEGRPLASQMQGYGDVKYHMGYSSDWTAPSGRVLHLSMAFNPSHLEVVNPVVEGMVRAKQAQLGDDDRAKVVPILLHGDAAFPGQGVVAETFTLAGLDGYCTGGTVHIIVNNQVGFTANPDESRSTRYASDLAKIVRAPVFHVNADHPEAVALVAKLAFGYRQTFHHDVVIDLVCFRRHGHNEMDDTTFTQPVMASLIRRHPSVSACYATKLERADILTAADTEAMRQRVRDGMRTARETARTMPAQVLQRFGGAWKGLREAGTEWDADTAVSAEVLQHIAESLVRVPEGWNWHQRLKRLMEERAAMVTEAGNLDWGCAEAMALGSLLLESTPVRVSGQDAGRGTFSHRHAIYADLVTGARHVPLNHIASQQAALEILNSPLSEEAVLGFEYGYSTADPWTLVVWEAQFGDFANGAQVIIDQLIASCEYKWGRMSGLVLLLPHGYEGQGPEHSSARLERFLELCAENNMQVCNLTTPAQYFHVLRRQMHRPFRKPLIIMSPKSLLRHPQAVSPLSALTDGSFAPIIADDSIADHDDVERVLMCSGKIYYPLLQARQERGITDVPIVRLEQLYPYPLDDASRILASYPNLHTLVWVQEEPRNMGAWRNLLHRFEQSLPPGVALEYAGRDSRATPATGMVEVHRSEEAELVELALTPGQHARLVRRRVG